jgi:hypothetical protein
LERESICKPRRTSTRCRPPLQGFFRVCLSPAPPFSPLPHPCLAPIRRHLSPSVCLWKEQLLYSFSSDDDECTEVSIRIINALDNCLLCVALHVVRDQLACSGGRDVDPPEPRMGSQPQNRWRDSLGVREESQWGAVAHMRRVSDGSGGESDSARGRARKGEIIESLLLSLHSALSLPQVSVSALSTGESGSIDRW